MSEVLIVAPLVLDDIAAPRGAVRGELGGSGAYAALVGEDFPQAYLKPLARIDLSRVERVAGPSFRWRAEHRAEGTTRTLRNDAGATAGRLPPLGDRTSSYVLIGAMDPALQERVGPGGRGRQARSARLVAIDTMPCYIDEDAASIAIEDFGRWALERATREEIERRARQLTRAEAFA